MKPSTFVAVGALFACGGIANPNFAISSFQNLMARMDPIVSRGAVADQVYSFSGTSNIREVLNTPEEQQRAGCVSTNVGADKSNYWSPTLYYIHDNNTLSAMQAATRIFYKLQGQNVQPWPKGMRIVTGTAKSKTTETRNRGLSIGCHSQTIGMLPNSQWPHETCGTTTHKGVELQTDFPSCGWANQSLDSGDHFSHLTWPIDTFTAIPWRKGRDNVVLSNGDLKGTTFHANFVSGWDEDVLREAINTCGHVSTGVANCPAFQPSYQPDIGSFPDDTLCPYQGKVPNEDIGLLYSIAKLPGCNRLWPVDQDTKPTCANPPPAPQWVAPNALKGGSTQIYPFVLKEEHKGAVYAKDPTFYGKSRVSPWGSVGRLDSSELMMPASPSINGWLPEDTNITPVNIVKGMLDASAWSGILPGDDSSDFDVDDCGRKVRRSTTSN